MSIRDPLVVSRKGTPTGADYEAPGVGDWASPEDPALRAVESVALRAVLQRGLRCWAAEFLPAKMVDEVSRSVDQDDRRERPG